MKRARHAAAPATGAAAGVAAGAAAGVAAGAAAGATASLVPTAAGSAAGATASLVPTAAGSAPPVPGSARAALAVALACAAIAALVFRGALTYGFSQDDFLGLARAGGLAPRLDFTWRPLSHQWFWDAMRAVAGLEPRPYHVVSIALHAACSGLVAWLLARRFAWPAALVAGAFFAAHGSLYTAVYWIAANGDVQAALWSLVALACVLARGRARWLAIPAFALSVLAKESTLLFPFLAMFAHSLLRGGGREPRRLDPVLAALFAVSALALAALVMRDPFSARAIEDANTAYLAKPGAILPNLLTYAGWSADFAVLTVRSFADQVERSVFPWGAALLLAWLAGAALPALRARGWLLAGAGSLAMLAPVLPLANHTYHYYLYSALPWTALGVAAACDAALSAASGARRGRLAATGACVALAAALAANGAALVSRIENMPFFLPLLHADATVDRALIASRAAASLEAAALPPGTSLAFWSPVSIQLEARRSSGRDPARETYWESNVRVALLDGLAVRVLLPRVTSVQFVRAFSPDPPEQRWAVYLPDGRLEVFTSDSLARRFAAQR